MSTDLIGLREQIAHGSTSAQAALEAALRQARSPVNRHTFLSLDEPAARAAAHGVDALRAAGGPLPPLAGLAVSVKDLFDVHGQRSTAAAKALADTAPAAADCTAVARLRRAGAALIGRTNMSEFAFSGVGINPHHGTPANPVTAVLDAHTARVPGGSTSGGAVSVATGAAWATLGSDTGGSIRIPAALQGLVGFKNTARLTPTDGAVPLSTTLDTACAITRSVRDAVLLHEVLADRRVTLVHRPLAAYRFAVPATLMLDGLDVAVARAFERTLALLRDAGTHVDEIALTTIGQAAALNAAGGFPAAESWAWHRKLLGEREAMYDPRVAVRIRRGERIGAADYLDLQRERAAWIRRMDDAMRGYDAMLSPTVPVVAPPLEPLVASDDAFFAANGALLRNPALVNFLDGCALSLPCHRPNEFPVGLMAWSGALADDRVLDASLAIESTLRASCAAG